ncbi:MAG: hypothetical protein ACR2NU_11115 [Aeoliella sp.]
MSIPSSSASTYADVRVAASDTPFKPGDLLRGSFAVDESSANDVRSAELSVVWYTAGKGEEDFAVHYFERFPAEGPDAVDLTRRREFRTLLPDAPLSYDGAIVKVCWCARLRLFMQRGRQHVVEASFCLGNVLAARAFNTKEPESPEDQ